MSNDLDEMNKKIASFKNLREEREAKKSSGIANIPTREDKKGMQAGVEFVASIFVPTLIGYGIDTWLGTKPIFFLIFFILGVLTAFYSIIRLGNPAVTKKNKSYSDKIVPNKDDSRLHLDKKNANKTSQRSKSDENR